MIKYLKKENFFDILLLPDILMLIFFIMYIVFVPNLIAALFIYAIAKFLMLFFIFVLLSFINKNVKNKFFSQWLKLFLKYTAFCLNIKLVISILLHIIYSTLL